MVGARARRRQQGRGIGGQLLSIGGGPRVWVDAPDAGPDGVGLRFFVTLLFPR